MKALLVTHGIVLFAMLIVAATLSAIDMPTLHTAWAVFGLSAVIIGVQWAIFYAGEDVKRGDS
jgi:membrane protein implicated in regulation of membrane protease activity